ncbi:hypothetical protein [Polyangium sorediatum]|uniref:Uncharacterized protein n=2 Tax=Polyangium TaxID=55 RepID=A0A4U1J3V6_9BACT|nr:hypothetical protein [Polyangium sorediatum]TKD01707.1 hypothetical protein E8A74_30655 [Polyangium fumosum]
MNAHSWMGRGMLSVAVALLVAACGGPLEYMAKGTPRAPDADAKIVAEVNSSTVLTTVSIEAEHLAPPDRLMPGATAYVVWARKDSSSQWQRIGSLAYNNDKRTGSLPTATVPLTSFELIVSAEQQNAPTSPSPHVVIQQKVAD